MQSEFTYLKGDLQQFHHSFLSSRKQAKSLQREWQKGCVQMWLLIGTVSIPGSAAWAKQVWERQATLHQTASSQEKVTTIRTYNLQLLFPAFCQAEKVIHA